MTAADNKQRIQSAYDAWAKEGDGAQFFKLVADDVQWTITGSSPIAGLYTSRQQFLDQAIGPLERRLSQSIRPAIRSLWAEGDTVIALWDGNATALDGQAYNNTYCWITRIVNGSIREAFAFFDAPPLIDLWSRVPDPSTT
jgi:ketosteroid isomerase-like protein